MNSMQGKIVAISVSKDKGTQKQNVSEATLLTDWGIEGDAHAGKWHRQVSLLAIESIEKMRQRGADVYPGNFAENITTEGIDLLELKIGDQVNVGDSLLEITQIGKMCHHDCAVFQQIGDCVMPREGLFAKVVQGGGIKVGDEVSKT